MNKMCLFSTPVGAEVVRVRWEIGTLHIRSRITQELQGADWFFLYKKQDTCKLFSYGGFPKKWDFLIKKCKGLQT